MPREASASSAWTAWTACTASVLPAEATPLLYASKDTGRILLMSITYAQISYHTLSSLTVESVLACICTQAPSQSCLTGCAFLGPILSWDQNSKVRLGIGGLEPVRTLEAFPVSSKPSVLKSSVFPTVGALSSHTDSDPFPFLQLPTPLLSVLWGQQSDWIVPSLKIRKYTKPLNFLLTILEKTSTGQLVLSWQVLGLVA